MESMVMIESKSKRKRESGSYVATGHSVLRDMAVPRRFERPVGAGRGIRKRSPNPSTDHREDHVHRSLHPSAQVAQRPTRSQEPTVHRGGAHSLSHLDIMEVCLMLSLYCYAQHLYRLYSISPRSSMSHCSIESLWLSIPVQGQRCVFVHPKCILDE